MTTYHNGWDNEKISAWVQERLGKLRLCYNDIHGVKYESTDGQTYENVITDHVPGIYGYTNNIYINGELVQTSKYE